jgi:hypothetical protein
MPKAIKATKGKEDESSPCVVQKQRPDARKYLALVRSGYPHKQAATAAGYSPTTRRSVIEKTVLGRLAALSIEEQRAQVRDLPGLSLVDCIKVAAATRDRKAQNPDVILKANAQVINTLGYEPPKQVQITEQRNVALAIGILHQIAGNPAAILPPTDSSIPDHASHPDIHTLINQQVMG